MFSDAEILRMKQKVNYPALNLHRPLSNPEACQKAEEARQAAAGGTGK